VADGERLELPNAVFRLLKDIAAYQKRRNPERKAALDRSAKDAFESGLYDRTGTPEGGGDE